MSDNLSNEALASIRLKAELQEIASLRKEEEAFGDATVGGRMALASLRKMEARVEEDLRQAEFWESQQDLEIALSGDPVVENAVEIGFIGKFLNTAQNFVGSVGFAKPAQYRVPRSQPRRLLLSQAFAGSFGMRLRFEYDPDAKGDTAADQQSVLQQLEALFNPKVSPADCSETLSIIPIRRHYRALVELLAKHNATMQIRTKNRVNRVAFSPKDARARAEWLDLFEVTSAEIVSYGELVGGSVQDHRFELKVGGEMLRGSISLKAKERMDKHIPFGAYVAALLHVTTETHEEEIGEPKVSYHLLDLLLDEGEVMVSATDFRARAAELDKS